ncbi:hypothetical protein VTJ04DRAFT_10280 [Mycothermus thermophilus]|uniref:uncharacterized protein n=1 Tax=Humicola insolens TaxID=85995 RepID=UPI003742E119
MYSAPPNLFRSLFHTLSRRASTKERKKEKNQQTKRHVTSLSSSSIFSRRTGLQAKSSQQGTPAIYLCDDARQQAKTRRPHRRKKRKRKKFQINQAQRRRICPSIPDQKPPFRRTQTGSSVNVFPNHTQSQTQSDRRLSPIHTAASFLRPHSKVHENASPVKGREHASCSTGILDPRHVKAVASKDWRDRTTFFWGASNDCCDASGAPLRRGYGRQEGRQQQ